MHDHLGMKKVSARWVPRMLTDAQKQTRLRISRSCLDFQDAGFELMEHPPYSPDLAPSDFYLFPRLKVCLRGQKFEDDEAVVAAVHGFLEAQDKEFLLRKF